MAEIRERQFVRTPDGTIGKVHVIEQANNETEPHAELYVLDTQDYLRLPVRELKATKNPNAGKRVAVENMPEERPRCQRCDTPLKFWTDDTSERVGEWGTRRITRRVFTGWRGYPQWRGPKLFCTLQCALLFAKLAYEAGYRITKKEGK